MLKGLRVIIYFGELSAQVNYAVSNVSMALVNAFHMHGTHLSALLLANQNQVREMQNVSMLRGARTSCL
jgi:hypothetical protein